MLLLLGGPASVLSFGLALMIILFINMLQLLLPRLGFAEMYINILKTIHGIGRACNLTSRVLLQFHLERA